jgi:hypothetical protein
MVDLVPILSDNALWHRPNGQICGLTPNRLASVEDGAVVLLTLAKPDALSLRLDVSLYFLLYGLPGPACGAQVPAAGILAVCAAAAHG